MKRSHGGYSKHSRNLTAGKKVTVAKRLLVLKSGDKVRIKVDPRHMAGRTQILRFNNRLGTVSVKQGSCYVVDVKDGNKPKQLVLSNVHLERV